MMSRYKTEKLLFYLLILFLPTQLGKHFWPSFSSIMGIRIDYLSPTLYFTDVLILLLLIFWLKKHFQIAALKDQLVNNKDVGIYLSYISFLLFIIFSSPEILRGLYFFLKFLELSFLAFYIAGNIREKIHTQRIAVLLAIGVIFESLLALFQFAKQGSVGGVFYFLGERLFALGTAGIANASLDGELVLRPYGTFPHPNVLAGYLVVALTFIVFSFVNKEKPWLRMLFFTSFVIGTFALLFSMSRIAIVLWMAFLSIALLARVRKKIHMIALALIVIGLFLGTYALFPNLVYRFSQTSLREESLQQRNELIHSAAIMIDERTKFGVGLGNFLPVLGAIQKPLSFGLYLQPVHNILLLVAAETGVVGFIFFTGFLVATLMKSRKHLSLFLMILSVVVLGFFDHYFLTLQQGQLLLALVVGLCWRGGGQESGEDYDPERSFKNMKRLVKERFQFRT